MGNPVRVRDILPAVPGMAERLAEARLLTAWPEIAGPAARRSHADRVEGGVLHVAVATSGWLHRLTLDETALLARCRAVADVRGIRFHLAPVGTSSAAPDGEEP